MSFFDTLLAVNLSDGGGGGGTDSYPDLKNKPQINNVTLTGNKTTADLIPLDNGLEINSDGEMAVSLGDGLAFNADGEIENQTEANPESAATTELEKLKVGTSIFSVVTKAVNDLANYYTKSDVYTKTEVNNIAQARFQVVAELPSSDIQTNVIYLVPKSSAQTDNDYDEYIYALKSTNPETYGWEKIGDTEIDLSGYVTTDALNTALANYTTTTDLTTLLAGKQNTLTFDSTPTAQSTNPVTSGGIKSYIDEQGAKTVSGNPITITDAEGMNADHVVATITPTQTGSGTPSPSNVRPFTGFSSVDVTRNSKNLIVPPVVHGDIFNSNGQNYNDGSAKHVRTNNYTEVRYNTTYVASSTLNAVGDFKIAKYNANKGFIGIQSNADATPIVIETGDNVKYVRIAQWSQYSEIETDVNFQLELGDQATTYEPYKGKAYTVQLGGTYYGGTLDVTSGKLTVTDGHIASYNDETLPSTWLSNIDEYAEGTTPTTGAEVVYKLATPIEIQLTPTQIELLENNNTITTNVSSLDVTYQTNNSIGDTASALDKRVTRLESKVPQPPTTDGTYKLTVTVASGTPTYSWESAT